MIYFLANERAGAVKIGFSEDVGRRVGELQTASPDRLTLLGAVPGDLADEAAMHDLFAGSRIRREWFRLTDDVYREVRRILREGRGARTVADELARRQGCRYGLRGVLVALDGVDGLYAVRSSAWGRDGRLLLRVARPEDVPPEGPFRLAPVSSAELATRLEEIRSIADIPTLADAKVALDRERAVEVDAELCRLMSPWPVVCRCWEASA